MSNEIASRIGPGVVHDAAHAPGAVEQHSEKGATDRCGACEATTARLYVIPAHRRLSDRAPRIACFFCYLHTVGADPRRKQLVSH